MTIRQRLSYYGIQALNSVVLIGLGMWSRPSAIGAMAGVVVMTIVGAVKDHRRQTRQVAERARKSALLDRQLLASIDKLHETASEDRLS